MVGMEVREKEGTLITLKKGSALINNVYLRSSVVSASSAFALRSRRGNADHAEKGIDADQEHISAAISSFCVVCVRFEVQKRER
jgi:hypothetical protein